MTEGLSALITGEDFEDIRDVTEYLLHQRSYVKVQQVYDPELLEQTLKENEYDLCILENPEISLDLTGDADVLVYRKSEEGMTYVRGDMDMFFELVDAMRYNYRSQVFE